MNSLFAYTIGMKRMQYTLRNISPRLDDRVREEAEKYHRSINATLLEALERGLGLADTPLENNDMDDLVGTWEEDKEFDRAVAAFDTIDEELWR